MSLILYNQVHHELNEFDKPFDNPSKIGTCGIDVILMSKIPFIVFTWSLQCQRPPYCSAKTDKLSFPLRGANHWFTCLFYSILTSRQNSV